MDRLVWDGFCETNVARYLPKRKEKAAIVAKGCDSRALVELIKENQVVRDQVVIIGVACKGMIDRSRIEAKMGRGSVVEDDETGEKLILKGADSEEVLDRREFLHVHCKACTHPDPVLYDVLVGQPGTRGAEGCVLRRGGIRCTRSGSAVGLPGWRDGQVHSLLRMPECLSLMLLPGVFRGCLAAPMGGQVDGPVGHDGLSPGPRLSSGRTLRGLRGLRAVPVP